MERIINRYDFSYETVSPYFIDHVRCCGKTLSERLIERIDFHLGKFYTFLPENIRMELLYEFSAPIILPEDPLSNPRIIFTTDWESSAFIHSFLQESENHCAIVEDYIIEAFEYSGDLENTKMVPYNNEVYYLLDKLNSKDEINFAIRCGEVWHTLIILTSLENGNEITFLNDEIIDKICDHVKYVIAGAYDGDAYMFWERSDAFQQLKGN